MSNETSNGTPLRLVWSEEGPNRYGMHEGVIYASAYWDPCTGWTGDPQSPACEGWQQAAREAEAAALVGAQARLVEARNIVRALVGSL